MSTRPSTDRAVDAFVAGRVSAGGEANLDIRRISEAPWIEALEARLPLPFPPSFRSLVKRYAFAAFDLGPVHVFANTGDLSGDEELAARVFADRALSEVLLRSGYLQFGWRAGVWYDPVCFDTGSRRGGGEYAIVRLDHEAALIRGKAHAVERLAPSFLHLLQEGGLGTGQ